MENLGEEAERVTRVRTAQQGDGAAFTCLVAEHEIALRRFCDRLVGSGSPGEDLAQETLLRAFQALPRLEDPARFGAWLFGIATNLARVAWRRRHRAPLSLEGAAEAGAATQSAEGAAASAWLSPVVSTPELAYERVEQARRLMDAIESLPPHLRHSLVLHYVEDLSYADVAEAMRVPVTTVKGWLHKSRTRLRRSLADGVPARPEKSTQPKEGIVMSTESTAGASGPDRAPTTWWEDLPTIKPSLFGGGAVDAFRAADAEARRWQHNYLGTEHLLLGVLEAAENLPARVLATLGAPRVAVRSALERRLGRGDKPSPPELDIAPRARIALELAREDMRFLKHERIGPEHLLLGLIQVPQGVAALILESMGLSLADVRSRVLEAIPVEETSPRAYWRNAAKDSGAKS